MVNMRPQYRCSSNVLAYNASIFVKSRPSYLIIDIEPVVDKNQQSNDQSYLSAIKDYASYEFDTDEMPVVIVSLNITDMNTTINETQKKISEKTVKDDTSIHSIIIGIGAVVVVLVLLLIIIKLIYKCYKMYKADDDEEDVKDPVKKSPLLSPSRPNVVLRKSSIRNPSVPIRRSSIPIEALMEMRQHRLSQQYNNTPPTIKKP